NNAYGVLESANQDLDLQLGSLANAGGRILHTGNGTFGLDSAQVIRAGGELTTNGLLDIRASEWTNSSVLQAGRLNLDIGTFRQTAEGKLLAVQSFTGRGGDWSNDGLLASDGSLRLELSGGYRGNGRATSLGDFALNAASLDLGNAASLAGGANVTLGAGNLLVNRGRITAAGDLVASAASLNNYGTLGGGGNLRLNAPALLNERGLLFSGADMTLRAGDITNLYGDVYSLGRLDIARDDAGSHAASLENISANIESSGDTRISASNIVNKKEFFEVSSELVSSAIGMRRTSPGNGHMVLLENYESSLKADAPSASISAGGSLYVLGSDFLNSASYVTASKDIDVRVDKFTNQGATLGKYSVRRAFEHPWLREDKSILSFWRSVMEYNASNDSQYLPSRRGGAPNTVSGGSIHYWDENWNESIAYTGWKMGGTANRETHVLIGWQDYWTFITPSNFYGIFPEAKYTEGVRVPLPDAIRNVNYFDVLTVSDGAQKGVADAVVQAAGKVSITASQEINNSVVREGLPVSSELGIALNTQVSANTSSIIVNLNSQLPPDLARQQINPLTLPGFSLPQGQNGLFRLASQGAQVNQASGALKSASDLTQSGHGVSVSAQAGSDASGWSTQARRVGDDRVTSLAGSAYQGRVAEAIDALRASAPISGDGGNTGRFQAGEHQATTGLGGLVEGNASGHSGNGVILAELRGGLPSFSSLPAADRVQGTVPGHDGNGTILANWQGAQATVQASPSTVRVEGVVSSPGGNGSILADLPAEQSSVQALPSAVRAQGSLPRLEERSAVLAEPPVGQPALQTLPSVARVEGVPSNATPSNSHKYLIETNPALTELKQFLNSDYLLGGLGINPDDSKKRLGDGLYEQRLVREAIVQRTGQRFIAGLNSDEAMFRYLMDNAIASKDVLGLTPGVTLSAAQVAALTHDIVWLEEVEVNGEKVLAPVVYLAQAEGRLGPNGALIQGRDVNLITGGDLRNAGTLRAQNDLSATAGNIDNSGLIEAGNRLDLLASGSIRNDQGGIIAGREVSLSALTGDVINERTVTQHQSSYRGTGTTEAFADSAARIEAAQKLTVSAGRDVANIGGVIDSKGDLALQGGRDVLVSAAVAERGWTAGSQAYQTQTTQMGAEVVAGRDISVSAGRDISVVGSRIDARRDVTFEAGRDVGLVAAANEEHAYGKTKKVTFQDDKITQQATRVDAGGDLAINAGQDLRLVASQASAGDEAYLVAGDKLELLAANDSSYYLYDKKSKGSFGSKKTRRDEITDVTAVGSQISSGGDLTLLSGGDQTYQGAKLESGNDLAIVSGGAVTFDAVKDLHQESHEKSKGDLAWQSSKGKGQTDETVRQSQLVAQGNLAIKAVEGLKIDLKHIDQKTVSQTIDAMVQADPQLAWLKEAEQRGDVDWRMVQEVHDSWKYSNSGLGAAPSLAIAIVAAAYLGPVYGAMASNLAIGTINNGGDLGKGLQQATSADSLKGYAIAAATAYLVSPQLDKAFGVSSDNINKVTKGFKLSTVEGIGGFAAYSIAQGFAQSVMQQAAYGGSYIDNLGNAMAGQARNLGMAVGFNFIGDSVKYPDGSPPKIMAHALMGGLLAEASGSDFKTGAAAAGANEAMINLLGKMVGGDQNLELMASQLVGVAAASAVNGDVSLGAEIAKSGTAYNRQLHPDEIKFASDVERVKRYAQENGLSEDTARKELLSTAAMMVDNDWNQALAGTDINAARAAQYLRTELGTGPDSNLFQVTQADYYNERVGLTALFKNKEALTSVLENIALANPASYTRDPANRAEVLNAKGEGSQAGFGLALEGIVSAPSKTALWLMGALTCSSCAERDIQNAWNSVASLPEDIRMKGYLDALHTMQGQGASVVRDNAASSTALGVEVGLAIDGGLAGAGKGVVTDGPKEIPKDLGKVSFDASNGVGTIYSPRVTLNSGEIIFDGFSVGTSKGLIGVGADGAAELVGPLRKMLSYSQSQGAQTITLKGHYASEQGSMLGTGSVNNVNQKFSFSFPATTDGLKAFLKELGK
ncbi:DUF637 domain-containing protein, partial [Pseudomonas aeruginosa]|uniref:DUF637 domain-containing protein n=1 Tax=Pseudomonas aeruginosa TaxID=287 RepID=UPI003BAA3FA5